MVYRGFVLTNEPACAQIELAHREFYRAFERHDLAQMERVWAHGAHVRCVHPGWDVLEGWAAVRKSWELIFQDASDLEIQLARVQVRAQGDLGWVTCVERILSPSAMGPMLNEILATNVFERAVDTGAWLMVQHHASPILSRMEMLSSMGRRASDPLN